MFVFSVPFILLFAAPIGNAYGDSDLTPIVVGGRVITLDGKPIANATVSAAPFSKAAVVTDSDGYYSILLEIPRGNLPVRFHVQHENYITVDKLQAVAQSLSVNFTLRPRHKMAATLSAGEKK